jgi:glyoxylase-like metal-dependent hydrolase (beta-lactamase superfamily II)
MAEPFLPAIKSHIASDQDRIRQLKAIYQFSKLLIALVPKHASYGDNQMNQYAEALGYSNGQLSMIRRFATKYTKADFNELLKTNLTFGHVGLLLSLSDSIDSTILEWISVQLPRKGTKLINIHAIKLGLIHCYVIRGDGAIMIDAGGPHQSVRFRKAMEILQLDTRSIRLIVITHGHWDHIGSAKDIQEITGAKIAMHEREKDWLEKSLKPTSPPVTGWGRIIAGVMTLCLPLVHFPAAKVDVVLGDGELSLVDYGIPGRIIYTPGHSMGSVSVLLDSGDAFVGDLAVNGFPLRLSPGLPIFAQDIEKVKTSWSHLLDEGAKTVYPAHGKPFAADVIRESLL